MYFNGWNTFVSKLEKPVKLQKSFIFLSLLLAVVTNFTACGDKSSGGATAAPGAPILPAGAVCAAGQVATQYGCLVTSNCVGSQVGYGFYPATNSCVAPSIISTSTFGQAGRWGATVLGVNAGVVAQLLRDAGQCDRNNIVNWGAERCSHYSNQANITISYSGGNIAYVQINAGISNPDYTYLMGYATGGMYNSGYGDGTKTVSTSLKVSASGTSGMQLVSSYSPYSFSGANQGLSITDASENFGSAILNLTINYNDQTLGTASAARF
jgi:hypothetical protein